MLTYAFKLAFLLSKWRLLTVNSPTF